MILSAPTSITARGLPPQAIPVPMLVVTKTGTVLTRNTLAEDLGLVWPRVPASWLTEGPLARVVQTGNPSVGPMPASFGLGRGTLACQPHGATIVCVPTVDTAAAEREEKLRFLEEVVGLANVGGWEVDLETNTPLWSDQVCRIHEVPLGHVPSMDEAIHYYAPEARPLIAAAVQAGIEHGTEWDLELPFITAKGKHIWVRARGRPIFRNGRCRRLLGSFEDITARRNAQEASKSALRRTRVYESLFQHINALAAVASLEGFFTRLNPAWRDLLGWTDAELQSRPFIDFVHPDDRERTIQETAALGQQGHQTVGFRNRYRKVDGTYVELSWVATSDPSANMIYAVATDVTEETRRAQLLQRLAMIAARTTNAVMITGPDGRLEWVNDSVVRVTGYAPADLIGKRPDGMFQGPGTDPRTVAYIKEQKRRRESFTAEVQHYRRCGTPYWVAMEGKPIFDHNGEFGGYMAIERDVTERRRAKADLIRARDRAEQLALEAHAAAAAKSGFLAMMSHELRTPMNGILGTAQLLLGGALTDEQAVLVQTLHDAGCGLLALLNDVLDYSKLEHGQFGLASHPFHLGNLVHSCGDLFRAEAHRRCIAIHVEVHPDTPESVVGDELRLRQVLSNLLGNAIKFTDEGAVHLLVAPTGDDHILFRVKDSGLGISKDDQARLFAPFTQVDSSSRRRFGGTGLGLAISHGLVELMGGVITLESELGVGSEFGFAIRLPSAGQARATALESTVAAGRPLEGLVVLLAEDNPINALVAHKLLERLGCTVVHAESGTEAVTAFEHSRFDIVLMDCHMPEVDGWQATACIRALEAGTTGRPRTPIIAQTASCLPEEVERCLGVGMDEVLAKPLQLKRLEEVIRQWTVQAKPA